MIRLLYSPSPYARGINLEMWRMYTKIKKTCRLPIKLTILQLECEFFPAQQATVEGGHGLYSGT